jgi:hypothetical protein
MNEITEGRYRGPLSLGLASLVVYVGSVLLSEVAMRITDGVTVSGMLIYVPGLAWLGYVAGQRRSPLGLLAIIAIYLAAALIYSVLRWS